MSLIAFSVDIQGLPRASTPLIGRDELVERIGHALCREGERLVTLVGPGGIGKTRVALAVAESSAGSFDGGVAVVSLAAVPSADLVASTIATALDVGGANDLPLMQQIVDRLRGQATLLVADNFEHLIEAAPLLSWLVDQLPELAILVTSRSALRLGGERVIDVPPLALPETDGEEDILRSPAVRLYLERTRSQPERPAPASPLEQVAAVCRGLDGLPLAIEIAAASGSRAEPGEPAWSAAGGMLISVLDLASDRQQTMSNAVAWSYQLLGPLQQQLFRRLSAFTGGFSIEAVVAINRAIDGGDRETLIEDIVSLIDQSLVLPLFEANSIERGAMLQTISEYGLGELRALGEADAFFAAHAHWYFEFSRCAEPELRGTDRQHWMQLIDADLGNIRAAVEWYRSTRQIEQALRLVTAIGGYWASPGHLHEGRDIFDRLIDAANDTVDAAVLAKALESAGDIEDWLMNFPKSQARYEGAVAICRQLGDASKLGPLYRGLGSIALSEDEFDRAAELFTAAIESSQTAGDGWTHADATNMLGVTRFAQGAYDEAIALAERARNEWREQENAEHIISGTMVMAGAALAAGRFALALEQAEYTLVEADRQGDDWTRARSFMVVSSLLIEAGREVEGARMMAFSDAATSRIGIPPFAWMIEMYRKFELAARETLGETAFAVAWESGAALTVDGAVREARAALESLDGFWPADGAHRLELSPRESEVLALLAQGKTDREIADALFIGRRTASKHVASILEKLDVPNRSAAASAALRLGLV